MTAGNIILYLIVAIGAVVGIGGSIWSLRITNRLYPSAKKKECARK